MSVSSEILYTSATYTGSTRVFPYTFRVFSSAEIEVVVAADGGSGVEQTLSPSDYTVSGAGSYTGGNVTIDNDVTLTSGDLVTIRHKVAAFLQSTDFRNQAAFFAEIHEDAFDYLTFICHTLKFDLSRALKFRTSDLARGVSSGLPAPEALRVIGWNDEANALQNIDVGNLAAIPAFINWGYLSLLGDGVQVRWTLPRDPVSAANLDVTVTGLTQAPGTDYTLDGADIVFSTPLPAGKKGLVRYGEALPQSLWPVHAASHAWDSTDPITPAAILAAPAYSGVSTKPGPYVLALVDNQTLVQVNVPENSPAAITVPPNSSVPFPIGAQIGIVREGLGSVSIFADAGVTLKSPNGRLTLNAQYSTAFVVKVATNVWRVMGDVV